GVGRCPPNHLTFSLAPWQSGGCGDMVDCWDCNVVATPSARRRPTVRKIAILPTLFTLGNAVSGFAAIAYASKVGPQPSAQDSFYFVLSACLILLAMAFDALDGYVARLSKSASDFGGQLDSLCDAVSFGLAPAFLLLRLGQGWEGTLMGKGVAVIAALYMVCAILRLARFNIENAPDASS